MKKVLMLILIMMMLAGVKEVGWAERVEASNFSEFNAAISLGKEQTIIVTDHIKSEITYNVGAGTKTVIGGGFNLDGNEKDAFRLRDGKTLKITGKLTMENFGYLINCAESSVSFDDSEIKISSNRMSCYGTMFFSTKSSLNINNSKMDLSNNTGDNGGVLACRLETTITINASTLTFLNNQASTGGAVYCGAVSLNINDSNLMFLNNKTLMDDGTMFFCESNISFSSSNIIFSSNSVNGNGGAIMLELSTLTITGSSLIFENNISNDRGGAITLLESTLTITDSSLTFKNNISSIGYGGATMLDLSTLTITSSSLTFKDNISKSSGGAMQFINSPLTITESSLTFKNNISSTGYGGAMYFLRSTTTITGSSLIFENNISRRGVGGAIVFVESTVNIDRVKVAFSSNCSDSSGGALGSLGANININGSSLIFSNNASGRNGGAMHLMKSTLTITGSSLIFENNISSRGYGGAVICSSGKIIFEDSDVEFTGNKARNGGALYILEGGIVKLTNVRFRDNIAIGNGKEEGKGGGIYIEAGGLIITTDENKISEFVGNKANGQSNGIYMYGAGAINFNGNGRVNMEDAIVATECSINIEDRCEFHLSGGGISKIGNLKIEDSSKFNLEADTQMEILGDLTIESNGVFNTSFGMEDAISILGSYIQLGTWTIDIEKKELNDYFFVGENVILGTGSTLNVDMSKIGADDELKVYRLIKYENGCTGEFGRVVFSGAEVNPNYALNYNYNDLNGLKWIVLTVKSATGTEKNLEVSTGTEKNLEITVGTERDSKISVGTKFAGIKGLSFNQKEVGRVLDNLSVVDVGAGKKEIGRVDEESRKAEIELINNMSEGGKKSALRELSGYFISNVIKGEREEGDRRGIYRRLESKEKEKRNIWAEAEVKAIREKDDEKSPEEYKNNVTGVLTGYDKKLEEGAGIGIYGKYRQSLINHGNNKGEVKVIGIGVYGGIEKEKIDVKTIMEGSVNKYKITREVMIDRKENSLGEFGGIRGSVEVEGGYNISLKKRKLSDKKPEEKMALKLRPYIGIKAGIVKTDGFKETGTNLLRLEVEENNYIRTAVRAGVGLKGKGKIIRWEAGAGLECCAAGRYNEIKAVFLDTKEEFKSRSAVEGLLKGEGNIKVEYNITDKAGAYIDGRLGAGNGYNDISCRVGIRYAF